VRFNWGPLRPLTPVRVDTSAMAMKMANLKWKQEKGQLSKKCLAPAIGMLITILQASRSVPRNLPLLEKNVNPQLKW